MADASNLRIAQQFSLPPPLVAALESRTPPESLLMGFGLTSKDVRANPTVGLQVLAYAVSKQFGLHGNLENALSDVFSGDPHAHESPTSPVAGIVGSVLAEAATKVAHGWDGFSPAQPESFGKMARDFGGYLHQARQLGGVVTDDSLRFWDHAVTRLAPPPKAPTPAAGGTGAVPQAPVPKGPSAADVERFAGEMKGLGIDVNHFLQHFPLVSALRYKLLASKTKLSDYAPVNGLGASEIVEHVRQQPHPTYPHLSAGQFADAHDLATLHALDAKGRTPHPAEVARFASSKAGWKEVSDYYARPASGG